MNTIQAIIPRRRTQREGVTICLLSSSLLCAALAFGALNACAADSPTPLITPEKLAKPTTAQYEWHEQERLMFIHLGTSTWGGWEIDAGNGKDLLAQMKLEKINADELCDIAKSWGAKQIIFVAKHVGGFCWWPSKVSPLNTQQIPWRGGKGNLVKEIADACRKHKLSMGVYIYPTDPKYPKGLWNGATPADEEAYNQYFRTQWEEALGYCGEDILREVWFDGGCKIPMKDIFDKYAPKAVIFQGMNATIRWPGNEHADAGEPNWNSIKSSDLKTGVATAAQSDPNGDAWAPLECDTPLYHHFWFHAAWKEAKRKSVAGLMKEYVTSVGHGSVYLLNCTPTLEGNVVEADKKRYVELGQAIERNFGHPLAVAKDKTSMTVGLELKEGQTLNCTDFWEDYRQGHRIRAYVIEAKINGEWREVAKGTSVGRRKIDLFEAVKADAVRVRITECVGTPLVRLFQAHQVDAYLIEVCAPVQKSWSDVGAWNAGETTVDITAATLDPRLYTLQIQSAKEGDVIEDVKYLTNGKEMGAEQVRKIDDIMFEINRSQVNPAGSKVELKLKIKAAAGSQGRLHMQ